VPGPAITGPLPSQPSVAPPGQPQSGEVIGIDSLGRSTAELPPVAGQPSSAQPRQQRPQAGEQQAGQPQQPGQELRRDEAGGVYGIEPPMRLSPETDPLPGEAAEGHLQKFGEMLGNVLGQVPANMKQKFLSAGLQVVGEDHASAKAAKDALGNYTELINEVQLRLTVDGPTRVGHTQPFGAFVGLEHTRQLAREALARLDR